MLHYVIHLCSEEYTHHQDEDWIQIAATVQAHYILKDRGLR